jgi:hypothetical protein
MTAANPGVGNVLLSVESRDLTRNKSEDTPCLKH